MIKVLPPKTTKEVVARERERKARTTLLMALPEYHLAKFYKMADAKEMWEASYQIKIWFQTLLSQLEIHGAGVSHEDANQKFLRSLPSSWSQVALIMRTKPVLDTLSFDDLYNNLRVFERDVKRTTTSLSNTKNVVFVSADNTSSTNDVSTAYSVSSPSVSKSQKKGSSSYTDEINDDDMEEMKLKWQVVMISMRIKKFHKRTGRKLQFDTKDPNQDSKRKDVGYNGNKTRDNGRRHAYQDDSKALVTIKKEDIQWSGHVEEDTQNYAMMAYSSSNSGSNNEVKSCSKACEESYARLKKLYDEQRDKLSDASVEITAYTLSLKKVEAQLLCHQQNQLAYEQKIRFMKIDLDDKTDLLAYHKKLLAEALKEKEDLKTKFENWQNSSKNLSRLLNTQIGTNDMFRLRYGDYRYSSILCYENEVLQSVFMNKTSNLEDTPINDRYADGMHVVPPPMTGNYMHSRPDIEIDYSKFTYGSKQTLADESDSEPSEYASCESDFSVETSTSMPEPVENAPKVVCEPKVWTDAPIIEEYESDSDNDSVSNVQDDKEKPSFTFTNFVKHVKTSRENIKETGTNNHSPKIEKQDRNGHTRKGLGYAFTRKSCFVCGNKAHLADYQEIKGGSVAFVGSNERITGKQKIKAGRQHYSFNIKNIDPSGDLACLFVKSSIDESNKWHRRLGHVNFKNLNKLVKGNLVRGLPSKIFENDHTCVACQKGKQHKASFKAKTMSFVNQPLEILHMDLFGPTSVRSISHKTYYLFITDGFSRFSWVYFLKSKDETTPILKDFIRQAENQFNHKVKTIRSDNETEFKNNDLIEFCGLKGIKREYSIARTPQQNRVAETGPLLRLLELC
nr:putative ribonuclease H-like domain-containing protein [Tanacetum cinerariifolium]